MKAAVLRELVASFQKKAPSKSRLPKVNVDGGWACQGLALGSSLPSYPVPVTVEMPLFMGGRIRAENAEVNLKLKEITQENGDLSGQISLEVKTPIDQLESARRAAWSLRSR